MLNKKKTVGDRYCEYDNIYVNFKQMQQRYMLFLDT